MLGALPGDAMSRGVYIFDGGLGEEISPGSLVAPLIGPVIQEADLVVETGAPPITLLSGVPDSVELPKDVVSVDGLAVFGSEEDTTVAERRIQSGAELPETLSLLAESSAPVGWAGPLPGCEPGTSSSLSDGTLFLEVSPSSVVMEVTGPRGPELENEAALRLSEESPAHSPGKPWRTILAEPKVSLDDDRLAIEAVPVDLPGGLLRLLLDTRALSFLRPADC